MLVWAAPLAGLAALDRPISGFLEFPPRTEHVIHAPFSWTAFVLTAMPAL